VVLSLGSDEHPGADLGEVGKCAIILRAIVAGERDARQLAKLRN
jgi:hypothetical protein